VLVSDDYARALSIFDQIADMAPDHPQVAAGRARALTALGDLDAAAAALDALPADAAKSPEVERARAALTLAQEAPAADDGELGEIRARAASGDMAARYELAGALMASDREAAADTLLKMIAEDREWNEGAARQRLLKLFEAVGLEDPWVSAQRRKLSAILFG
jgi:putative thioredoxin